MDDVTSQVNMKFHTPEPVYFDEKFGTLFENCIKDKFEGLDHINEVSSDYVKSQLREAIEAREGPMTTAELFAKGLYKPM
jgi:hypothetical protein